MKSGDIKESELLEEASEMMNKMKNMPGMGNIKEMFGKMGMGGAKMDINAMRNNIAKNMKNAKQRERMKEKLFERQRQNQMAKDKMAEATNQPTESVNLGGGLEKTYFRTGEASEKTMKRTTGGNKKKKRKKKK